MESRKNNPTLTGLQTHSSRLETRNHKHPPTLPGIHGRLMMEIKLFILSILSSIRSIRQYGVFSDAYQENIRYF
jgi:hypothetical protein